MARLIDADKFRDELLQELPKEYTDGASLLVRLFALSVDTAPTVDAVPVVQCGECRKRYTPECALHQGETCDEYGNIERHFCGSMARDDFYCGLGARMDRNERETV